MTPEYITVYWMTYTGNIWLSISKRLPYKVQPRLSSNSWAGGGGLALSEYECFKSGKILGECDEGILRADVGVKNICPPYLPQPGLLCCSSPAL